MPLLMEYQPFSKRRWNDHFCRWESTSKSFSAMLAAMVKNSSLVGCSVLICSFSNMTSSYISHRLKQLYGISGEAGDGFGVYHIKAACSGILHHGEELWPPVHAAAADASVCVDCNQLTIWILRKFVAPVCLLEVVVVKLRFAGRGHAHISHNLFFLHRLHLLSAVFAICLHLKSCPADDLSDGVKCPFRAGVVPDEALHLSVAFDCHQRVDAAKHDSDF